MKRFISFLLALIVLCTTLEAMPVFAAQTLEEYRNIWYAKTGSPNSGARFNVEASLQLNGDIITADFKVYNLTIDLMGVIFDFQYDNKRMRLLNQTDQEGVLDVQTSDALSTWTNISHVSDEAAGWISCQLVTVNNAERMIVGNEYHVYFTFEIIEPYFDYAVSVINTGVQGMTPGFVIVLGNSNTAFVDKQVTFKQSVASWDEEGNDLVDLRDVWNVGVVYGKQTLIYENQTDVVWLYCFKCDENGVLTIPDSIDTFFCWFFDVSVDCLKMYMGHDHQWSEEWTIDKQPTCTQGGYKSYHCLTCSLTKDSTEIPPLGHDYQWVEDVPATKTTTGLKHEECTRCHDKQNENTVIEKLTCDHVGMSYISGYSATCTANGKHEYWKCDQCGRFFADASGMIQITTDITEWSEIPKLGHDYGKVSYVWKGDQCTATRACSRDSSHIESETIAATYVPDTNATCAANEKGHYYAEFQDETFGTASTEKNSVEKPNSTIDHNYVWVEDLAATKTSSGLKHLECTMCHDKKNENTVIDPLTCVHEHMQHSAAIAVTCTTHGCKEYWYCPECLKYFADDTALNQITANIDEWKHIEKLGHSFTTFESDKNATCTTDGTKTAHCDHAGCESTKTVTDIGSKLGHDFKWIIDREATKSTSGLKHEKCSRCPETRNWNTVIDKLPCNHEHISETPGKLPTCDEDGMKPFWRCLDCGLNFEDEACTIQITEGIPIWRKIDKLGHDYDDVRYVWDHEKCTATRVCKHDLTHIESETVSGTYYMDTEATCTEDETGHYEVTFNNEAFVDQKTDPDSVTITLSMYGHNYQWIEDVPATKTSTGIKHEECSRCHDKRNENTIIDVLTCDHSTLQEFEGKAATCVENGIKTYWYCPECLKYYADENCLTQITTDIDEWKVIKKLGHLFIHYQSDNNATCTADGTKTACCDRAGCNAKDTVVDEGTKKEHSFVLHIQHPTEELDGCVGNRCTECGLIEIIDTLKHDVIIVYGDLTGDGRLDAFDYMIAKAYLLGNYPYVTTALLIAMDVDFSGDLTMNDTALLKAVILGTDVIGKPEEIDYGDQKPPETQSGGD